MKKYLYIAMVTVPMLSSAASAETTIGIGVGPLYNGLGLNFGKTTPSSFVYGALGCVGITIADSGDPDNRDESNCGVGFGYISASLFSNDRHALGLNIGLTHNTDKSQTEVRVRPGYHYFFNGINKPGLNLGVGPIVYYDTDRSNNLDSDHGVVFFNIGYQF